VLDNLAVSIKRFALILSSRYLANHAHLYLDRIENCKPFRHLHLRTLRIFEQQVDQRRSSLKKRVSSRDNGIRRAEFRDGAGFSLSREYNRTVKYLIGARYKISSPERSYVSPVNVRTQIRRCNIRRSKRQCMVDRAAIMWVSGVARLSPPLSLSLSRGVGIVTRSVSS